MTLWIPFVKDAVPYDLRHLHPTTLTYVQPSDSNSPERIYLVDIQFGLHCFTRGIGVEGAADRTMLYSDARESRIFDFSRYELSKRLPSLVRNLTRCKCYHTNHGNFFTVYLIGDGKEKDRYEVYFALSRSTRSKVLNLFVQSAYVRDAHHYSRRKMKSVRFFVLLFNTLNNRPISPPP